MTIWFTSDTHYGHRNIVRGVSSWGNKSGCRDFDTLEAMNDAMVERINQYVQADDVLYHIGDWSMGGHHNIAEFRKRLNCREIHLVYGNHDQHIRKNMRNERSLFTSVQPLMMTRIGEQRIVMCHFPMLVWEDHHRGVWHFHGHSHGHLNDQAYYTRKVIDVGIDAHPEFRPYRLDEVTAIMTERSIVTIDHH